MIGIFMICKVDMIYNNVYVRCYLIIVVGVDKERNNFYSYKILLREGERIYIV